MHIDTPWIPFCVIKLLDCGDFALGSLALPESKPAQSNEHNIRAFTYSDLLNPSFCVHDLCDAVDVALSESASEEVVVVAEAVIPRFLGGRRSCGIGGETITTSSLACRLKVPSNFFFWVDGVISFSVVTTVNHVGLAGVT